MGREFISSVVAIATLIIAAAVIATLVSRNTETVRLIGTATSGFACDLQAVLSAVTGRKPQCLLGS